GWRARPELELDAAHFRAHRRHVQPRKRALEIAHEQPDEPGPVLSLQRELFIVDDDGVHWQSAAARCPERTADSIVAGRPVSIQSPASHSPRTPVSPAGRAGWPGAS